MPTILDATVVNQAYDTSGNGGRKLVRLSNGWLVAGMKNGTTDVKFYKSEDNGQIWSLLTTITESNPSLSMVAKGTDIYVLLAYSTVVRAYKIDGLTGEKSSYMSVDNSQNSVGECSLTINEVGTELHAAWASKNSTYPNSFNIRYAKGTINADGSVTWGAVEQVTIANTTNFDFLNPSIVMYGNEPRIFVNTGIYVPNENNTSSTSSTYAILVFKKGSGLATNSTYVNSNYTFKQVYNPNANYTQSSPSACVAPNGRIWVAWHGAESGYNAGEIRVSYSDDGGVTWSTQQRLTTNNQETSGINPSITVNKNNEVFILYNGRYGTATYKDIYLLHYNGSSWTNTNITNTPTTGHNPNPSALVDLTIDFTQPLFIYSAVQRAKVGFYGAWVITTISVTPGYIGQKTSADKSNILTYFITTDGEMSDIIEKINGTTIATRTNPTNGQQFTVSLSQEQWDAIKYGNEHTLTIEMDSDKWTYTFDKRLNADDDILSAVKGVQDLETHLNGIKTQLGSAIRAKGGTVNDTDAWSSMINVLNGLQTKKWASGIAGISGTLTFTYPNSNSRGMYYVQVTGLNFNPNTVLLIGKNASSMTILSPTSFYSSGGKNDSRISVNWIAYSDTISTTQYIFRLTGNANNSNGFILPVSSNGAQFYWLAIE